MRAGQVNEESTVLLSALNQYAYCPRRCGLIFVEGEFEDNIHTMRGTAEHEQVDLVAYETKGSGARVEYALPVWCDRLGLVGKCDVVEFWPDGTIYPVEYKHGARKKWMNDDLQLASQALCLEEMLSGRCCMVPSIMSAVAAGAKSPSLQNFAVWRLRPPTPSAPCCKSVVCRLR